MKQCSIPQIYSIFSSKEIIVYDFLCLLTNGYDSIILRKLKPRDYGVKF